VQRGTVRPLITMLEATDPQLPEMAAFALGRLAQSSQNTHNQAGIVHDGGLRPLLELLDSKNGSLQHNAAFALYGLADNEVRNGTSM
jgi:HEAT repeat protein